MSLDDINLPISVCLVRFSVVVGSGLREIGLCVWVWLVCVIALLVVGCVWSVVDIWWFSMLWFGLRRSMDQWRGVWGRWKGWRDSRIDVTKRVSYWRECREWGGLWLDGVVRRWGSNGINSNGGEKTQRGGNSTGEGMIYLYALVWLLRMLIKNKKFMISTFVWFLRYKKPLIRMK